MLRKACEVMIDREKSKLKKAMEAEGKDTGMRDQKVSPDHSLHGISVMLYQRLLEAQD